MSILMEQTSEKEIKQGQDNHHTDEEIEIDLMDILRKIISIRKKIYKAAGIGLVIGIIVAISIPKQYTVTVTLSPEMGGPKEGNGLAGIAASFLGSGTSMGDGIDALNVLLSSDIVASTPFLLELFNMEVLISDNGDKMTLESYLDGQSSPWWNYIIGFPGLVVSSAKSLFAKECEAFSEKKQKTIELTKEQIAKINYLKKVITVVVDKKTTITSISVTLQNPKVTAVVADSVVHRLQEYIINYRTSKAKEDCVYLEKLFNERQCEYYAAQKIYADYVDTHDNLILQSVRAEQERLQNDMDLAYQVYSQVANQLQVARAKVQEEKPVFAVLEPAIVPLVPSGNGMKFYILLFVFLSVIFTVGWMLIGNRIWGSLKNEIKEK